MDSTEHGSPPMTQAIRYLTASEIYSINENVTGRLPFVRDRHLLISAVKRPQTKVFGQEAYPTVLEKAAALLHSLAAHHLFGDGNKRTAQRAVTVFLEENGIEPIWKAGDSYKFILEIAMSRHDVEAVTDWLTDHTRES